MDVHIEPDATARRLRGHVRDNPDLIYDEYKPERERSLDGGCYLLSEAYFHASGGTDSNLTIHCLSWSDVGGDGTHWFLMCDDSVVDLGLDTVEQAEHIPYGVATRRAFITGYNPSNRCERVLRALDISY